MRYIASGSPVGPWEDFICDDAPNATITKGDAFSVEVSEEGWFDITVTDFNETSCRLALAHINKVSVEDVEIRFYGICPSI